MRKASATTVVAAAAVVWGLWSAAAAGPVAFLFEVRGLVPLTTVSASQPAAAEGRLVYEARLERGGQVVTGPVDLSVQWFDAEAGGPRCRR